MGIMDFLKKKEDSPELSMPSAPEIPVSGKQTASKSSADVNKATLDMPPSPGGVDSMQTPATDQLSEISIPDKVPNIPPVSSGLDKVPMEQQKPMEIEEPPAPVDEHEHFQMPKMPTQHGVTDKERPFEPMDFDFSGTDSSQLDELELEPSDAADEPAPVEEDDSSGPEAPEMPPIKPLNIDGLEAKQDYTQADSIKEPEKPMSMPEPTTDEAGEISAEPTDELKEPRFEEPAPAYDELSKETMPAQTPAEEAPPVQTPAEAAPPVQTPTEEALPAETPKDLLESYNEAFGNTDIQIDENIPTEAGQPPEKDMEIEKMDMASKDVPISKRIINESMFVNVEVFKDVAEYVHALENDSRVAEESLLGIKDITLNKEKAYDKWRNDLEQVERELIQLDKILFNV